MATDRIQINLDNDTANFRANQAALALARTHRPQNTTKVYSRIEKEWGTWCRSCNFDDGDLVDEAKLVRFLSEEVVNRALKNSSRKRKRDENTSIEAAATSQRDDLFLSDVDEGAPPQTLKFQSIRTYKTGVMNLYFYQAARGLNNHPNPNGAALRSLMKAQRITQHQKAKEQHEDRGRGTIADGYNLNTSLSSLLLEGFNQQREQMTRLESKLEDFLDGKIAFTLTPVKRQKILNLATKDAPTPIDPDLQSSSSPTNSASFAASTKEIVPSLTAERQRSSSSSSPPSSITYTLSRQVQTVTDLFKEWTVGLGNGPSIASLNDQYGYGWRRGWGSKDKEFYSKRLAVIKAIYTKASGGSLEAAVTATEAERVAKGSSLNAFAVQLRKASNS